MVYSHNDHYKSNLYTLPLSPQQSTYLVNDEIACIGDCLVHHLHICRDPAPFRLLQDVPIHALLQARRRFHPHGALHHVSDLQSSFARGANAAGAERVLRAPDAENVFAHRPICCSVQLLAAVVARQARATHIQKSRGFKKFPPIPRSIFTYAARIQRSGLSLSNRDFESRVETFIYLCHSQRGTSDLLGERRA